MVLKLIDQMADEIDDEVGRCLRELTAIPTWTVNTHLIFKKLEKLVEGKRYFGELLTAVFFYICGFFAPRPGQAAKMA